jgi:V8-like Glu-specific endopeptidase
MNLQIQSDHKDAIVEILANRASLDLVGSEQAFFKNLIASSNLPQEHVRAVSGRFSGNAEFDARRLLDFAIGLKVNPIDPRYTVVGSLIVALLKQKPSPDDARTLVAILVGYQLILDKAILQSIAARYMVPLPSAAEAAVSYGPPIAWLGPASDVELQSFFRPEPAWLDVGFLKRAMQCASSVCRIEIGRKSGTGFLIADTLVLTNFHVLKETAGEDLQANAKKAVLRFGAFSLAGSNGGENGQVFKLAEDSIVAQSPIPELDFALLKVELKIQAEPSIHPAPLDPDVPASNSPLNILHHPEGGAMKLSLSGNGVTGVYQDRGIIQYVTAATGGSSGSPCFNDDWKVVALHHAQQARKFGSIREGILMGSIHKEIKQFL